MILRYIAISIALAGTLFAGQLFGQIERGSVLIGGSGTVQIGTEKSWSVAYYDGDHETSDKTQYYFFNLNSELGFCVVDGFFLGFDLSKSWSRHRDSEDMVFKENSLGIGPMGRYYIPLKKVKPYVGAGLLGGCVHYSQNEWIFSTNSSDDSDEHGSSYYSSSDDDVSEFVWFGGYNLGTGIGIFLTENFSLDVGIKYSSMKYKHRNDDYVIESYAKGTSLNVGMYFFF